MGEDFRNWEKGESAGASLGYRTYRVRNMKPYYCDEGPVLRIGSGEVLIR